MNLRTKKKQKQVGNDGTVIVDVRTPKKKKDYRHVVSQKQEKGVAKILGGKVTPGSKRGDVELPDVDNDVSTLVECKTTTKSQITIKKTYLEKITNEAYDKDASPRLVFGFSSDECENHWIAMPVSEYERMRKRLQVYQQMIKSKKDS